MKFSRSTLALAAWLAVAAAPAQAVTFSVGPIVSMGVTVAAHADITTSAAGLTIHLFNDLSTPITTVGQALSEIYFDLSGLTAVSGTVSAGTGRVISVSGAGAVSSVGNTGDPWGLSISGQSVKLSDLLNGPDYTLLPTQSNYSSANSSIAGNRPHNPFYQGDVTFALSGLTGVTANSKISNVAFNFGTTQGGNLVPVTAVPEPETYALMLAGLGAIGFVARRRKQG